MSSNAALLFAARSCAGEARATQRSALIVADVRDEENEGPSLPRGQGQSSLKSPNKRKNLSPSSSAVVGTARNTVAAGSTTSEVASKKPTLPCDHHWKSSSSSYVPSSSSSSSSASPSTSTSPSSSASTSPSASTSSSLLPSTASTASSTSPSLVSSSISASPASSLWSVSELKRNTAEAMDTEEDHDLSHGQHPSDGASPNSSAVHSKEQEAAQRSTSMHHRHAAKDLGAYPNDGDTEREAHDDEYDEEDNENGDNDDEDKDDNENDDGEDDEDEDEDEDEDDEAGTGTEESTSGGRKRKKKAKNKQKKKKLVLSPEDVPTLYVEGSKMMIAFKKKLFNDELTCSLCGGYFRDATTIPECVHTFCRLCLLHRFVEDASCPKCQKRIPPQAYRKFRRDTIIQDVVNLVYGKEETEEDLLSAQDSQANHSPSASSMAAAATAKTTTATRTASSATSTSTADAAKSTAKEKRKKRKTAIYKDNVTFSLVPDSSADLSENLALPPLPNPILCTSARCMVRDLKRFIRSKIDLPKEVQIEVLYSGELLGTEHSLEYILKSRGLSPRSYTKNSPFLMYYRRTGTKF